MLLAPMVFVFVFVFGVIKMFILAAFCRIYLWYDDKGKKTKLPAPQYIDMVMTMVQKQVFDESVFPTKYGKKMLAALISNKNLSSCLYQVMKTQVNLEE